MRLLAYLSISGPVEPDGFSPAHDTLGTGLDKANEAGKKEFPGTTDYNTHGVE